MPLMILVLIGVLIGMYLSFGRRQRLRDCRWRENHSKNTPDGRYFICMNCGAETVEVAGKMPDVCLKSQISIDKS